MPGLQAALTRARYEVRLVENDKSHVWAQNPNHGLNASFGARGLDLAVRAPEGKASNKPLQSSWRLASLGYGHAQRGVGAGALKRDGQRVTIARPDVTEWFHNTPRGLEHGFTLAKRPADAGKGAPLRLEMSVGGDLVPFVDEGGQRVSLRNSKGREMLSYAGLKVWDSRGKRMPAVMRSSTKEGRRGLALEVRDGGAKYPLTIDPTFAQQAYLKPAGTPRPTEFFGSGISVSGDTVVVGADAEDTGATGINPTPGAGATNSGAAYVFVRSGTTFTQQAFLKASPGPLSDDRFGGSVSIDGDTLVVGARQEDTSTGGVNNAPNEGAAQSGAAYVFVRSGVNWTQQAFLKASNPGANDGFGTGVSVSGNTVVVGALGEDSGTTAVNSTPDEAAADAGAAYVFARSGTTWSQQAYLKNASIGTSQVGDNFGRSVGISGDTIVVGAPLEDSNSTGTTSTPTETATTAGAALVFTRSGTDWTQQAYLKAPEVDADDQFGIAVSISGNTIAVGAPREDGSSQGINQPINDAGVGSGAAYIFVGGGVSWTQQAYIKSSNSQGTDSFGEAINISGDALVVGAPVEDGGGAGVNPASDEGASAAGAAYAFSRSGATWVQDAYLKASNPGINDRFGGAVGVGGNTVAVGAQMEDSGTSGVNSTPNEAVAEAGAAYVYASDDPGNLPTIGINSLNVTEGNIGTTTAANFVVALNKTSTSDITVNYSVSPGTATAGTDYGDATDTDGATPGVLTIPAGELTGSITVPVTGDAAIEANETFVVTLATPTNATIGPSSSGTGTIVNDEFPTASIGNASVLEGGAGTTALAQFTVTLSQAAVQDATFTYSTLSTTPVSAIAGTDYVAAANQTLVIPTGQTTGTINITVNGDTASEFNERFLVRLLTASGATLDSATATGTGTITNDDATPVEPGSLRVTITGDVSSTSDNETTLREAINFANGNNNGATIDAISFAPNVRSLIEIQSTLDITSPMDIQGPGGNVLTVAPVSGGQFRIFTVASLAVRISGLALTGGRALTSGPNEGDGTGGAILVKSGAQLLCLAVTCSDNSALGGGAIENFGTIRVASSSFLNNSATLGSGGAIHSVPPSTQLAVQNSTFLGNSAATDGGAIRSDIANTQLDSLTIATNTANSGNNQTGTGGGLSVTTGTGFVFSNSIVVGNTPNDLSGAPAGANRIGGTVAEAGLQNNAGQPTLALNASNAGTLTVALLAGSPAINAGDSPATNDQRGVPRPFGVADDLGAYEYNDPKPFARPDTATTSEDNAVSIDVVANDFDADTGNVNLGVKANSITNVTGGTAIIDPQDARKVLFTPTTNANGSTGFGFSYVTTDGINDSDSGAVTVTVTAANDAPTTPVLTVPTTVERDTVLNVSATSTDVEGTTLTYNFRLLEGTTVLATTPSTTGSASFDLSTIVGDDTNDVLIVEVTATDGTDSSPAATANTTVTAPRTLSISDVTLAEGNTGQTLFSFNVTLSSTSTQNVTVDYALNAGTTSAGELGTPSISNGMGNTLLIGAGFTTVKVTVPVNADTVFEADETFTITLSNPQGAVITDGSGLGTITNDDILSVGIGGATVTETDTGNVNADFTVTLSAVAGRDVTVTYNTGNELGTANPATANTDYVVAVNQTLTILAGQTTGTISIPVIGDNIDEESETFTVRLTNPTPGATFSTDVNIGTILNDDTPTVSIGGVSVAEGNAGTTTATFPLTLSNAARQAVTVNYSTTDGTATATNDYVGATGQTATIAAGQTTGTINITVNGDTVFEGAETFTVTLSNPTGATLGTPVAGTGTIQNDDNEVPSLIVTTTSDTVSATDGLTSLREAILLANGNAGTDTITFSEEVFAQPQTITLTYRTQLVATGKTDKQVLAALPTTGTTGEPLPAITGALIITGPNTGVLIEGRVGPANALFSVNANASASSTKLFFSGSRTGIRNNGTFNLTDGGFANSTTNLQNIGISTLVRCFVGQSSQGIANTGTLTVDGSTFSGITNALVNAADATATVKTSTFEGNAAGVVNNGTLTLSNSTLSGNGDGVRNQTGSATLIQSTLVGNTNAVVNSPNASLRLLRATVAGNGDGLRTGDSANVEVRSTLLVSNGQNLIGTPTSGGSNLTSVTAQVAGLETDGNGFPLLKMNGGPTATVALLAGSRAINAGEAGIKTGNDQRGTDFPRVVNGRADIGAFEFGTPTAPQNANAAPSGSSQAAEAPSSDAPKTTPDPSGGTS